jgi:hypothetical protein
MTDDIETKALALVNEVIAERGLEAHFSLDREFADVEALCRAIERHEADKVAHASQIYVMHSRIAQSEEQHEAFKQEVSDAVKLWRDSIESDSLEVIDLAEQDLLGFIIPNPKPDPLVEMIEKCAVQMRLTSEDAAKEFRAALDDLGFEIREKGQ